MGLAVARACAWGMGEIQGRYRGDTGLRRYRGDIREIYAKRRGGVGEVCAGACAWCTRLSWCCAACSEASRALILAASSEDLRCTVSWCSLR